MIDVTGGWRLTGWTRTKADGTVIQPHGDAPQGRLIYQPDGRMAAFLMHPDWPTRPVDQPQQGLWFLAYSGAYAWRGDVVSHQVDFASDPRWIGSELRRRAAWDGETLTLETIDDRDRHQLTWVREA